jgi:hypothetical protein
VAQCGLGDGIQRVHGIANHRLQQFES